MVVFQAAGIRVALGQRRDDNLRQRVVGVVPALGLVPPDDNHTVVGVSRRGHDLRHHRRQKVVPLRDGRLVSGICRAVVGEPAGQRAVRVVILVGRDPVVAAHRVVVQVGEQLAQLIDVLVVGVGEERHGIVLGRIIILAGAVVGIDDADAGTRGAVLRPGGQLQVFLVILPQDARRVQLRGEVRRGVEVCHTERVRGRGRIVVGIKAEIRRGLLPDIIRLGGMHADAGIEVARGIGNLRGVRIAWRDQAVQIGRGRIGVYLLRTRQRVRLRKIMVLHGNHKHRPDLLQISRLGCGLNGGDTNGASDARSGKEIF